MAILLWDGQFQSQCAFSHVKWALEGQLHELVVDVNKIHLDGGIDRGGRGNGNEALGINDAVAQDWEDYANVVSVQDNSGLCVVVLVWMVVDGEEVGSAVHTDSIHGMAMNDRSG